MARTSTKKAEAEASEVKKASSKKAVEEPVEETAAPVEEEKGEENVEESIVDEKKDSEELEPVAVNPVVENEDSSLAVAESEEKAEEDKVAEPEESAENEAESDETTGEELEGEVALSDPDALPETGYKVPEYSNQDRIEDMAEAYLANLEGLPVGKTEEVPEGALKAVSSVSERKLEDRKAVRACRRF